MYRVLVSVGHKVNTLERLDMSFLSIYRITPIQVNTMSIVVATIIF